MRKLSIILLLLLFSMPVYGLHTWYVYVDPDATGNDDGGRDGADPNDPSQAANWTDAYDSLQDAEAGEQQNLVTADRVLIICCQNSGGSADVNSIVVQGWTTDATRYLQIEAYSGDRHTGSYSASYYHLTRTDGTSMTVREDFVRLVGLQFGITTTANNSSAGLLFNQ